MAAVAGVGELQEEKRVVLELRPEPWSEKYIEVISKYLLKSVENKQGREIRGLPEGVTRDEVREGVKVKLEEKGMKLRTKIEYLKRVNKAKKGYQEQFLRALNDRSFTDYPIDEWMYIGGAEDKHARYNATLEKDGALTEHHKEVCEALEIERYCICKHPITIQCWIQHIYLKSYMYVIGNCCILNFMSKNGMIRTCLKCGEKHRNIKDSYCNECRTEGELVEIRRMIEERRREMSERSEKEVREEKFREWDEEIRRRSMEKIQREYEERRERGPMIKEARDARRAAMPAEVVAEERERREAEELKREMDMIAARERAESERREWLRKRNEKREEEKQDRIMKEERRSARRERGDRRRKVWGVERNRKRCRELIRKKRAFRRACREEGKMFRELEGLEHPKQEPITSDTDESSLGEMPEDSASTGDEN